MGTDIKIHIDVDAIETAIQEAADSALESVDTSNIDFSGAVEYAVDNADFSDAVESAVDNADFSGKLEEAMADIMDSVDLSRPLLRALKDNLVRAEFQDYIAHSVKRAIAIQFGMVTDTTHQDELDAAKEREEALRAEIAELRAQVAPTFDASPLGDGVRPLPFKPMADPYPVEDDEDMHATECFVAKDHE